MIHQLIPVTTEFTETTLDRTLNNIQDEYKENLSCDLTEKNFEITCNFKKCNYRVQYTKKIKSQFWKQLHDNPTHNHQIKLKYKIKNKNIIVNNENINTNYTFLENIEIIEDINIYTPQKVEKDNKAILKRQNREYLLENQQLLKELKVEIKDLKVERTKRKQVRVELELIKQQHTFKRIKTSNQKDPNMMKANTIVAEAKDKEVIHRQPWYKRLFS